MKKVDEFLKEQECNFTVLEKDNKVYFCEYSLISIAWYGKPVKVGIEYKDTCIVTEKDKITVIDYSAENPLKGIDFGENAIKIWENAHNLKAEDYIDEFAKEDWLKACEEE